MSIEFETPENILLSYKPAGLGSRYIAWMIDWFILILPFILLFFAILANIENISHYFDKKASGYTPAKIIFIFAGLYFLLWGLVTIGYFGFFELIMRGQTPGKKIMKLRVVSLGGFTLDAASICIRTVFRVIDNLPPLWIVVLLSKNSQRLGDIVAKTIVVSDDIDDFGVTSLKQELIKRDPLSFTNKFNPLKLKKMPHQALTAAEQALVRWETMDIDNQQQITRNTCAKIAEFMELDPPSYENAREFLEELLATVYRQQYRNLG